MKAKGEEGTRRMLAMLLGSQAELMQKAMFTGWRDLLIDMKRAREVDRIKAGMKAKGDESTKRMLAMLMGSQMDVLKKAAFAGWWEHLVEEKQHNAMREMQQSMRAKGAESTKRMLGMLLGAQNETLLKASFAGWAELHVAAKIERMREEKLKMRSKEDESRRRMLGMLMGSQSSLIMKMAFTGWSDTHYEAKKLREVEKMRREMRSKGDESTKRMLGMLMSSQGEALLKAVFSSWHETAVESHIARMRDDMAHMKSKKEQGTQKMLAMLLGSQAELMQKAMFTGWHELVAVLKKDRETERMKAAMKAKGDESSKRMLAMLMGSQQEVLKKASFAGWWEHVTEVLQKRKEEQLKSKMKAKGDERTKRMMAMLMHSQTESLLKSLFSAWCDDTRASVREKFVQERKDRELDMKRQKHEIAQRMLGRALGANQQILKKIIFTAFQEIVAAMRIQGIREDNLRMRSKADESQRRMLTMLMGSQGELLAKAAFSVWQELMAEKAQSNELDKLRKAMNSKSEEHTKRMLGILVSSQGETLVKALFSSWTEIVVEKRTQAEVDRVAREMKEKGQESSKRMLTMLMSSQQGVVVNAAFSSWRDLVLELRKENQVEKLKRELRSKGQESAKRMLGMLMGSQKEVLMKAVLAGFAEIVNDAKLERVRQHNNHIRSKDEESARRMLVMLTGSQDSLVLKTAFGGWQEFIATQKSNREVDNIKRSMQAKGAEQTKRMLAMMMGSQDEVVKAAVFSCWREHLTEIKQADQVAQMKQDMRAKGAESSRRMLGMLMGSQSDTLIKAILAAWQDFTVGARVDRMREEHLRKIRGKEEESQRRMLAMLVGSQGSLLTKSVFAAWSECVYESRQLREVEKMRRDMKSKGDESTKRMLGMLMNSQSGMILKAAFAGWIEVVGEMRVARMREDFASLKAKSQEGSRRMLGMLIGSQGELMQKAMFTAWYELVSVSKQEREIDRLRLGLKAKGDESAKRMLTMLMGSQEEVIKKATFAGWREYLLELRQEHEVYEMQQSMRAKGAESSKRMLGMLLGSKTEVLIKASFAGWRDVVATAKIDRIREESLKMRAARTKEQESQRRMLLMLTGSQGSLLLKTAFSGWCECIYQLRQIREVEKLRRDMRSKGDESVKRMLGMLMNSQSEVVVKAGFAGWHDVAVEQRIARMKDDLSALKAKGQEGTKRMLGMLLGSQSDLMQKAVFTAWHELIFVMKQEREVDRLRMGMKAKGDESAKRMLTMLMGSQDEVLKKAVFAGWHECLLERAQRNAVLQMQQDMRAKGAESSKRMLRMLLGSQNETLMKASFAAWVDLVTHMKMDRMREKMREENRGMKSKERESQRRMLTMLMGSQDSLVLKTTFSAWSECVYDLRQLREVEKMRLDMKSKGDESTKRMLGMLMNSQADVLTKAAFAGWHEVALEGHFEKMRENMSHMRSKGEEGTRRMLAMLLGSQGELMQKAMFTAWREMIALMKQEREVDRIKAGMKAKGEESTKRMLAMLMGSQDEVVKKAAFAGWRELVVEVKQQSRVLQMQQDMRAKGAESSKRMLGMLLGSQAETVMKASFASWQEHVITTKMDRMRSMAAQTRTKEQESQRRMLTMLMGSQDSLVVKTTFSAWSECIYQLRQLREVEKMKREMRSKGDESSKRMLGMLMSSQADVLVKAAFSGWHELAVQESIARMRGNMAHMKAKGGEEGRIRRRG